MNIIKTTAKWLLDTRSLMIIRKYKSLLVSENFQLTTKQFQNNNNYKYLT